MRVYLLRHGETDANAEGVIQGDLVDLPLNARGESQARALARHFATQRACGLHVDATYASPLRRAHGTAARVADALGQPRVAPLPGLREISWGAYMGEPNQGAVGDGMRRILGAWAEGDFEAHAPGGETLQAAWERAWRELEPLTRAHRNDTVVIVAHGRINKVVLSMLLHGDLHHMEEFPQRNGGMTLLEHDQGRWYAPLRDMGSHLDGLVALDERH